MQETPYSQRKQGNKTPVHRGYFVDVKTLVCALLSGSWSLASLSQQLQTEHVKAYTENHGELLTSEYLDYSVRDVQTTWECYERLRDQYESYGLSKTPIYHIFSEASIGKAYLKQMGIKPFRVQQPDFPPELYGIILSTYYGGRAEVKIRRKIFQMQYCDFLSMYPTVCILQNLWQFVIADSLKWQDTTEETQKLLDSVCLADLRNPSRWRKLTTLEVIAKV